MYTAGAPPGPQTELRDISFVVHEGDGLLITAATAGKSTLGVDHGPDEGTTTGTCPLRAPAS